MTHPTRWSLKQNPSDKVTSDKNCSQCAACLNSPPESHRHAVWLVSVQPLSHLQHPPPQQRRSHCSRVNVGVCGGEWEKQSRSGWVFPEGTCGRWGRRGWGYRRKEVCRLRCDGRVWVSPGELRKTYAGEGVPVTDTQIREVKASLQFRPPHPHHHREGGEMKSKGEIWSNPEILSFQNSSSPSFWAATYLDVPWWGLFLWCLQPGSSWRCPHSSCEHPPSS